MLQAAEDWKALCQVILGRPGTGRPDVFKRWKPGFYVFPSRFAQSPWLMFCWRARKCPSTPIKPYALFDQSLDEFCGRASNGRVIVLVRCDPGSPHTMGRSGRISKTLELFPTIHPDGAFTPRSRSRPMPQTVWLVRSCRPVRTGMMRGRGWTGLSVLATISTRACKLVPGT